MAKLTYKIVEHDGGWAYKVGSTYSETFHPSGRAARRRDRFGRAAGGRRDGRYPV